MADVTPQRRVPGFLGRVLVEAGRPVGTCFQVAPGFLVTACHVLEQIGAAASGAIVAVDALSGGDRFDARVAAVDRDHDLAVLQSDFGLTSCVPGFAATDTVPTGTEVTVVAVPEVDDRNPLDGGPRWYRFVEATGQWRGGTARGDGNGEVTLGRFRSVDVLQGMSGAPVCQRADGTVVGIVSERYNSADGWLTNSVWAVRTENLATLLQDIMPLSLLDVSEPAVTWRSWQVAYGEAIAGLARDLPDALLVAGSGPPMTEAHVRRSSCRAPVDRLDQAESETGGDTGGPKDTDGNDLGCRGGEREPAGRVLTATEDCWLLGGPGAGKSRLLRSWSVALVDETDGPIPILVRAADLASVDRSPTGPTDPVDVLARAVNIGLRAVGRDGLPSLVDFLTGAPHNVSWLVLVDAVDEIPDARSRRRVFVTLAGLRASLRDCRIVVAGRPLPHSEMAEVDWLRARYDLLPLEAAQWDTLVADWFADLGVARPDRAAAAFAAELDRQGMRSLARIPLMLVILAQLFACHPDMTLPASRVEAYERIVEEMHRREPTGGVDAAVGAGPAGWAAPNLPAALTSLRQEIGGVDGLLSCWAFERCRGSAMKAVDWVAARTEQLRRSTGLSPERWCGVVREELRQSRLVVTEGEDFTFVHATLHEFFAARHAARDRTLGRVLLLDHFGLRAKRLPEQPARSLRALASRLREDRDTPLIEWIYAFWHDWRPFTKTLLRLARSDALEGSAFIALLAWRGVRLSPSVVARTRRTLTTSLAQPVPRTTAADRRDALALATLRVLATMLWGRARTVVTELSADLRTEVERWRRDRQLAQVREHIETAALLAVTGDPAGLAVLAEAVGNPELGSSRLDVGKIVIALGDPRGPDLLADATEAVITEPDRAHGYYSDPRVTAVVELAQSGHPRAIGLVRRFLGDERVSAETRRETYERLTYQDPNGADVFATMVADLAVTNRRDAYAVSTAVDHLLDLDDAGSADRLATVASAAAVDDDARMRIALRLAQLGDPRAADTLTELAGAGRSDVLRLRAAWELAELGDLRAVSPLVSLADPAGAVDGVYPWWVHAKALARSGNPACRAVLAAVEADPALPVVHRSVMAIWLTLVGAPGGTERALAIADEPQVPIGYLYELADAVAYRGDPRFVTLLAAWIDRRPEASRWDEGILAAPQDVLGVGLYATEAADRQVAPGARWQAVTALFERHHPHAMDRLITLYHDLVDLDPNRLGLLDDAVHLLASKGSSLAVPHLVAEFREPKADWWPVDGVRAATVRRLAELDHPAAADALVALAPELVNEGFRQAVANRLEKNHDPRLGGVLLGWLLADLEPTEWSSDWEWKLRALLYYRDPCAVDALRHIIEHLLSRNEYPNIHLAIQHLADTDSPRAADLVATLATDKRIEPADRVTALSALARRHDLRTDELADRIATDLRYRRRERRRLATELEAATTPRTELDTLLSP
jgi:S1-C subfamily serine protease/HEAT repeat protein